MPKSIIINTHFYEKEYLGSKRLEYFREWLSDLGYESIIITRGTENKIERVLSGTVISIVDPILKYDEWFAKNNNSKIIKSIFIVYNVLSAIFLIPDKYSFWNKSVLNNPQIKDLIKDAKIILSSNPPESGHLLNYSLSKKYKLNSIIDIRDGWNDESLNFYRKVIPFRRMYESFLEKKVYKNATTIITNSPGWQSLILKKNSDLQSKISVVYNRVDPEIYNFDYSSKEKLNKIEIGYAGKFSGSSFRRKPELIFKPFEEKSNTSDMEIMINLWGSFRAKDIRTIDYYKAKLCKNNTNILLHGNVDKRELFLNYCRLDGFFLLSLSIAAIPSKLYEYLYTGKPILAFVIKESAIYTILKEIHQVVFYFLDGDIENSDRFEIFVEMCLKENNVINFPEKFQESTLKENFQNLIKKIKL